MRGEKAPTKDAIESEVDRQLVEVSLKYELHNAFYEKLQGYWYSIPTVLESIKIRIGILHGDRDTASSYSMASDVSENILDDVIEDMMPDSSGAVLDFTPAMQ